MKRALFLVGLLAVLTGYIFPAWPKGEGTAGVVRVSFAGALAKPEGARPVCREFDLRHRWDSQFPGQSGRVAYYLLLPPAPPAAYAILLERVGNQAAVSIDAVHLGELGRTSDTRIDAGKHSHVVVVPAGLLKVNKPAVLQLDVTMQALRGGGVSAVYAGPRSAIEAMHARLQLRDQILPAAYAASLLLMGGLAAGVWWRQRDRMFGCFSLAALSGSLRHIDNVWLDVPIPWPIWGAVLAVAYACHLGLIARFILLVIGYNARWLVLGIYAVLATVVTLAILSFVYLQPTWWTAGLCLFAAMGMVCFVVVCREVFVERRRNSLVMLCAGSLLLAAGLHDLLTVRTDVFNGAGYPLAPHALFLFVVILAGIVVNRYSDSVLQYRRLNDSLAKQIAERERQLGEAFEALRRQREEQAVMGERQRIMREIHDGVGSQLVGLLNMVRQRDADRPTLEQHVNIALDEMRMAIDSLQPVHSDLTTVLATLRYRLQPRLTAAGLHVAWDVAPLPPLESLSPHSVLQVQRILLEAFTNVLKHAQATELVMSARYIDEQTRVMLLTVSDNGVGIVPSEEGDPAPRQGIANMQARADAIGARLCVEPGVGGGTRVVLEWPVPGAANELGALP